ncbi:MAG: heavy metal-responsive transcriptional regulator [Thermoleophilia bacterium]
MRIGELARRADVTPRAIRHYERIGVLPAAERTGGGYRDYGEDALMRLAFVRSAQAVGLTLGEIREVVAFRDRGESPCAHVVALLERRRSELSRRILEMQSLRAELEALVSRARTLDPADCRDDDVCHVVSRPARVPAPPQALGGLSREPRRASPRGTREAP